MSSVTIKEGTTTIGASAFYSCENLTSIVITEGTTIIDSSAFAYCSNLTHVILPSSLTNLSQEAFANCNNLVDITVSEENTVFKSIDGVLLSEDETILYIYPRQKTTTDYVVPANVNTISASVFVECDYLVNITLPVGISIDLSERFKTCDNLENIHIDEDNEYYKSVDGIVYSEDGKTLIYCPKAKTGDVVIPDGVETILAQSFAYTTNLGTVTVPSSVKTIEEKAFYYSGIDEIIFEDESQLITIGNYAFAYSGIARIVVPASLVTLGNYAFYDSSLSSIEFEKGCRVTKIGTYTFYSTNISTISLPKGVYSIGEYAFYYCSSLQSIILPDSLLTIGNYAFYSTSLRYVYYEGSKDQWKSISKGSSNSKLTNSSITYDYVIEPEEDGEESEDEEM